MVLHVIEPKSILKSPRKSGDFFYIKTLLMDSVDLTVSRMTLRQRGTIGRP